MTRLLAVATLATLACTPASSRPNKHAHHQPLSVDEHRAEANRHTAVAEAEESAFVPETSARAVRCTPDPLEGQSRIGTEPIRFRHPCFTSVANPTARHLQEAADNRREARRHRLQAKALQETERRMCAGLDAEALSHSPFQHVEDIVEVHAVAEGGEIRGASVTFAAVDGLTADFMRRSLNCHQARSAALGFDPSFMPYCLASVRDVRIVVTEGDGRVTVAITGSGAASATAVWARAGKLKPGDHKP